MIVYAIGVMLLMRVQWVCSAIQHIPRVKKENAARIANILGVSLLVIGIILTIAEILLLK